MIADRTCDLLVIGCGPSGQKAAIQGAKAGRRVVVVEEEGRAGGACVRQGTIPSKTLRETALSLENFRRRSGDVFPVTVRADLRLRSLMSRLESVIDVHETYMTAQLARNTIELIHGRARFQNDRIVEVRRIDGSVERIRAEYIVIATGSRPRTPADMSVDHENVLDSDSILSLPYLPASLIVLGGGVIASEYASIFASLGVEVTLVDGGVRPLPFLDAELTARFLRCFAEAGGHFLGGRKPLKALFDGVSRCNAALDDGSVLEAEKILVALGRTACLDGLEIGRAGLEATARGVLSVDENCRTAVSHIYAVGDVIGPPGLASASMEQGRRAVRHALGLGNTGRAEVIPTGIYTIPEMSMVGLTEEEAIARQGGALVGRAPFRELARGQIAAMKDGLIKLVADAEGRKVLGVHVLGEGATELIHVGQMALLAGWEVDAFVDNIFNFPTLAEGYRVAALDIVGKRTRIAGGVAPVAP